MESIHNCVKHLDIFFPLLGAIKCSLMKVFLLKSGKNEPIWEMIQQGGSLTRNSKQKVMWKLTYLSLHSKLNKKVTRKEVTWHLTTIHSYSEIGNI